MTRTRVEASLVRPGTTDGADKDASLNGGISTERVLKAVATGKMKGLMIALNLITPILVLYLEVAQLILKMKIWGETINVGTYGKANGCLIDELGSLDCRAGCQTCFLNEKLEKLLAYFPNKEDGPGIKRCIFYKD